jgi:hypothetical protein
VSEEKRIPEGEEVTIPRGDEETIPLARPTLGEAE